MFGSVRQTAEAEAVALAGTRYGLGGVFTGDPGRAAGGWSPAVGELPSRLGRPGFVYADVKNTVYAPEGWSRG